ncbi:MAG: PEPxxWA-CTERM sorting domain-containing protein [Sandarakinorhabdus sp.]|nr:PEPxxWA-CTERM sorting domain-containing protein [Sandarakinorhabdus sp.]
MLAVASVASATAAQAAPVLSFEAASPRALVDARPDRTVSGTINGLAFEARSNLVARTSTGTLASGGDPRFFAATPQYRGVVGLLMETTAGNFVCSGSLLPDRVSIITAAHCVSDGFGTADPIRTTAWFYNGSDPDVVYQGNPFADPNVTSREVSRYIINPGYTGEVIDQNDIAIIRLANAAPGWATSYDVDFTTDLTGQQFNIAGLGRRSTIGGDFGDNAGTGRLRQGDNRLDFRFGDADWGGFFTNRDASGENFFGFAEIDHSWILDFDNGLEANDGSCRLAGAFGLGGAKYCDLGIATEVGVAGGDSGGPGFINGRIVSVNSYSLSFGTGFGDIRAGLNNSFGELDGVVPTYIHESFITAALGVPEPQSWAMLIAGFGLTGAAMRRRRAKVVAA